MQAVFRLVEDDRLRAVHYLVGDLLATMRRQAVHEQGVVFCKCHEGRIDLEALELLEALVMLGFVAHRRPGVGEDDVGARDGVLRVVEHLDGRARLLGDGEGEE